MSGDERQHVRRTRQVKRPSVPAGPLRDLKDAVFDRYLRAATPTLDTLAESVESLADQLDLPGVPRRDTIGRIIGRDTLPPNRHDTVAVAMVLAHLAGEPTEPVAEAVSKLWHAAQSRADRQAPALTFLSGLRERALETHSWLEVIHTGRRFSAPLSALYIERQVITGGVEFSLDSLLEERRLVVVLGDPGVGKSTLVNRLALALASGTDSFLDVAPVVVTIRDHATEILDPRITIVQLVHSAVRRTYELEPPAGTIEALLADGRLVLLFDGLDELNPISTRIQFVSRIERFADRYPAAHILVTSRSTDYETSALKRDAFTSAHLPGFADPQIVEYATRWLTLEADGPATQDDVNVLVAGARTFEELHGNPLLLTLMCALYRKGHLVAENRVDLIELFIKLFFTRWDELRGLGPEQELSTRLRAALARFAWTSIYETPDTPVMSRRQATALFVEHLTPSCGREAAEDEARALLQFCAGRSWLLTAIESDAIEPVYGFTHRTFLDFLAAEHLVLRNPDPVRMADAVEQSLKIQGAGATAHLAFAMFEREVPGGGDAILRILSLRQDGSLPWSGGSTLSFAIQCLPIARLQPLTLDRLCREAVDRATLTGGRFPEQYVAEDDGAIHSDSHLQQIAERTSGEHVDHIVRAIVANVISLAQRTHAVFPDGPAGYFDAYTGRQSPHRRDPDALIAALAQGDLLSDMPFFRLVAQQLRQAALPERTAQFVRLLSRPGTEEIAAFGAGWLFCEARASHFRCAPYAARLLQSLCTPSGRPDTIAQLELIAEPLLLSPRPWIRYINIEGLGTHCVVHDHESWIPHFTKELLSSLPIKARDGAVLLTLPWFGGYRWPEELTFLNLGYNNPAMTDTARIGLDSLNLSPPVARLVESVITQCEHVADWA